MPALIVWDGILAPPGSWVLDVAEFSRNRDRLRQSTAFRDVNDDDDKILSADDRLEKDVF